jgi:hypothetical protein
MIRNRTSAAGLTSNAALIEKYFAVSRAAARQYMERLVADGHFGALQPDEWHYPPVRKLRLPRTRRKPTYADEFKVGESALDKSPIGGRPDRSALMKGEPASFDASHQGSNK